MEPKKKFKYEIKELSIEDLKIMTKPTKPLLYYMKKECNFVFQAMGMQEVRNR